MYKLVIFSGKLSTKLMLQKDERVKVMTEILRGIRVIKLHVWEDHFVHRIKSEYGTALLSMLAALHLCTLALLVLRFVFSSYPTFAPTWPLPLFPGKNVHVTDHPVHVTDHRVHVTDHPVHVTYHSVHVTDHPVHVTDHPVHITSPVRLIPIVSSP
jgi:hypothetical protein